MSANSLNILTYNIHKGFSSGNRQFVLHQIREQLHNLAVDFVFLQEIQGQHIYRESSISEWPAGSQFEFLADRIWPHYAYGKNAVYNAGHHGNAILSKYPFIHWENINVSSMRRASRSLLHGVVKIPGIPCNVHLICIHLDLMAYERTRQLKILVNRIREFVPAGEPLILAGDFNDWRGIVDRHLTTDLGLMEVFQYMHGRYARTYPSWLPFLPVDRIYFRGLKPLESICYKHSPWQGLSDHIPLSAKLQLIKEVKAGQG